MKKNRPPAFKNGYPANLEAVALECLEWLQVLRSIKEVEDHPVVKNELERLDGAIAMANKFLSNKEIMWLKGGEVCVRYIDGTENTFKVGETILLRKKSLKIVALCGPWAYVKGRRYQRTALGKLGKIKPTVLLAPCNAQIIYSSPPNDSPSKTEGVS